MKMLVNKETWYMELSLQQLRKNTHINTHHVADEKEREKVK